MRFKENEAGRRCRVCNKPLALLNKGQKCWSCRPRFKEEPERTVCSSRVTAGFNRVYAQYHGWARDL